jgi:hypothetical protein
VGVVFAHAWYDFPHIFGLHNFTDFLDWMKVTLDTIARRDDMVWLLKPHPLESWYGHFRLADLVDAGVPSHVRVLPEETDSPTAILAADVAVTVHGTIAFEAAAQGLPVICADRSYYDDWPFAVTASSRGHYIALLTDADRMTPPDADRRNEAAAFAYFACAPHPFDANLVQLKCDSSGIALYQDIADRLGGDHADVGNEISALSEWLALGERSYSVYTKQRLLGRLPVPDSQAMGRRQAKEFAI